MPRNPAREDRVTYLEADLAEIHVAIDWQMTREDGKRDGQAIASLMRQALKIRAELDKAVPAKDPLDAMDDEELVTFLEGLVSELPVPAKDRIARACTAGRKGPLRVVASGGGG